MVSKAYGGAVGIFQTKREGAGMRWPFMYITEVSAGGFKNRASPTTFNSIVHPKPSDISRCVPEKFLLPLEFLR